MGRSASKDRNSNRRKTPKARKTKFATCEESGKVRYRDHHDAVLALQAARIAAGYAYAEGVSSSRKESRVYKCDACKGWHLTSMTRERFESWEKYKNELNGHSEPAGQETDSTKP